MPNAKGSRKATTPATPTGKGPGPYQAQPSQPSSWHLQPGQSSPRGASRVESSGTSASGVSPRSGHGLPSHKASAFPATEAAAARLYRSAAAEHAESQPLQSEPLVVHLSPVASTPHSQKRSPAVRSSPQSGASPHSHPRQQRHVGTRDKSGDEPAVSPFEFDLGTGPLSSGNLTTPPRWGPAAQASSVSPQPTPASMASSSSGVFLPWTIPFFLENEVY